MPRPVFQFDLPERFVAGTVGTPGDRTFYLQARAGARVVSVALEKVQVSVLAERLGQLLDEVRRRLGPEGPVPPPAAEEADLAALDAPVEEEFRVGTLSLAWDGAAEVVVIEAEGVEESAGDETAAEAPVERTDDDEGPAILRVSLHPSTARAFVARAERVVSAGRPPCPLCGQPLDPSGHVCPRQNGHRH